MVKVIQAFTDKEIKTLRRKVRPAHAKRVNVFMLDPAEIEKLNDGENGGPCATFPSLSPQELERQEEIIREELPPPFFRDGSGLCKKPAREENINTSMDLKKYLPELKNKRVEGFKKEVASYGKSVDAKIIEAAIKEIEKTNDIEYNEEIQELEHLWPQVSKK